MPASAVLVVVVVAAWPVLAWPLRARFGVRAGMVPPLASLALVPFVAFAAAWARAQPIVDAMPFQCGTGDVALAMLAAPFAGGALVVATLWARYVASPPGRARVDRTLRACAVLAIAAGAVTTAPAIVQAWHAPDADGWADSLPQAQAVPDAVRTVAFAGPGLWSLRDVRRDDASDLWVVTRPGPQGRVPVMALGCALTRRTIVARDLRALSAPHGWIAESVGGLAVAALAIVAAGALAARHRRRHAAIEATHLGGGWVATDGGGPPMQTTELLHDAPGPVLVRLAGGGAPTYRASGLPWQMRVVARGSRESVEDAARSIAAVGYAVALAVTALACAPLAVA